MNLQAVLDWFTAHPVVAAYVAGVVTGVLLVVAL